MSLEAIKNALVKVTQKTYHYYAPPNTKPPYVVWAEDGSNDFMADGTHAERAYQGTVDLYTRIENDPFMESIPAALDVAATAWYLNSVQYEEDTKLIHYEWVFEV